MTLIYIIIGLNVLFSWKGFEDYSFFEKFKFQTDRILHGKEYVRMVSSGFLHVNYMHLLFNMYAFYMFAEVLTVVFSDIEFILLYLASLLAGNLLSLFVHRDHSNYSAVGASGAVSGVIYASIALIPDGGIGLIFIPGLYIPSWIFGIIYILYTIFGIKSQRDNIGHEAHLGGAIAGMILTVAYFHNQYVFNYVIIAAMLVPTFIFLYFVVYHPEWLLTGKINWSNNPISRYKNRDKSLGSRKEQKNRQAELDDLLDRVNDVGYVKLTDDEKRRLDQLR